MSYELYVVMPGYSNMDSKRHRIKLITHNL